MNNLETLLNSPSVALSCGTVTLDPRESRALVIHIPDKNEYLLPISRLNVDPDLRRAAITETFEETGVHVRLLGRTRETRATSPGGSAVVDPLPETQPFAMTGRFGKGESPKKIYWFAAVADSTIAPAEVVSQYCADDFEIRWLSYRECLSFMTFADEKGLVQTIAGVVGQQSQWDAAVNAAAA